MLNRRLIIVAALTLPLSTEATHAMDFDTFTQILAPCLATVGVANKNNYGNKIDNAKISVSYGFMLFALMNDERKMDLEDPEERINNLYYNDRVQFATHYQSCLKGARTMLEAGRNGIITGMAKLGY